MGGDKLEKIRYTGLPGRSSMWGTDRHDIVANSGFQLSLLVKRLVIRRGYRGSNWPEIVHVGNIPTDALSAALGPHRWEDTCWRSSNRRSLVDRRRSWRTPFATDIPRKENLRNFRHNAFPAGR